MPQGSKLPGVVIFSVGAWVSHVAWMIYVRFTEPDPLSSDRTLNAFLFEASSSFVHYLILALLLALMLRALNRKVQIGAPGSFVCGVGGYLAASAVARNAWEILHTPNTFGIWPMLLEQGLLAHLLIYAAIVLSVSRRQFAVSGVA